MQQSLSADVGLSYQTLNGVLIRDFTHILFTLRAPRIYQVRTYVRTNMQQPSRSPAWVRAPAPGPGYDWSSSGMWLDGVPHRRAWVDDRYELEWNNSPYYWDQEHWWILTDVTPEEAQTTACERQHWTKLEWHNRGVTVHAAWYVRTYPPLAVS